MSDVKIFKESTFELKAECLAYESILVKKYQSTRTGITAVIAAVPGPLVHGFFVVATEAENDDGLPHTLEHLIFLGSHDYPYKGTLDIMANRCLASGTNAWTDIDHTAYTISTAGAEGFLTLLPIYMDHLFFPTLTDAGFITEVYHITGEGKDAGVVFCEMQHYESTAELLTQLELMKGLYRGNCGYRYETGGAVNNLRRSTTIDKIRKYHNKFYCAENLTVIVTGLIEEKRVLEELYKFENKLLSKNKDLKFAKAWQNPVPPLLQNNIKCVTYPSDTEDHGVVLVGWQGPSVITDYYKMIAASTLFHYLVDTAASPLMKHFVETEDQFCSDISVTVIENSISAAYLTFKNVVLKKIPYLSEELLNLLGRILTANADSEFSIDATRMQTVVQRFVLKQLLALEKEPQNEITMALISDVLYGNSNVNIFERLNHNSLAIKLKEEPLSFWQDLLKDHFINRPHVTVLGYPSKKDHVVRSHFENERRNNQVKKLGNEGLKEREDILQKANEQNQKLPPDDLIGSIKVPNVDCLHFHDIKRYTSATNEQHPDFNIKSAPVFVQLDDIKSHFIYLYTILDSSSIPSHLRIYLPLFLEYILEAPIRRNDKIISHEETAKQLEIDVIKFKSNLGLLGDKRFSCANYSYLTTMNMVILPQNYDRGVRWIRDVLFNSVFIQDRLKVVVRKLISSISQIRRQGHLLIKDYIKLMVFNRDTNHGICSILCQLKFLSELSEKLADAQETSKILSNLQNLRCHLTQPGNIILHIATDISRLVNLFPQAHRLLNDIIPENEIPNSQRKPIRQDKEYIEQPFGSKCKSCVVGMANVDSAYLHHCCLSINDSNHPDIAALLVFIQYITQLEGPMWRDVRGFGLAYHYDVKLIPEEGLLYLLFSRATDVIQAFRRTRNIFMNSISGTSEWNRLHFESAKSSLIFEIAEREKNVINLANQSLMSHLGNTSQNYNRELIQKVKNVEQSQMNEIGRTYITPLFDPKTSLTAVLCDRSNSQDICEGFSKLEANFLKILKLMFYESR